MDKVFQYQHQPELICSILAKLRLNRELNLDLTYKYGIDRNRGCFWRNGAICVGDIRILMFTRCFLIYRPLSLSALKHIDNNIEYLEHRIPNDHKILTHLTN